MPGNIGSSNASENTSTLWQTTEESRGYNKEEEAYLAFVNDCFVKTGATKPMTPIEEKGPPAKPWLRLKDYKWKSGKTTYNPRHLVPMRLDWDHIYLAREFYFHFKNNFARISEAHAAYCERTAEGFEACFVDGDAQKIYDDITDEFCHVVTVQDSRCMHTGSSGRKAFRPYAPGPSQLLPQRGLAIVIN